MVKISSCYCVMYMPLNLSEMFCSKKLFKMIQNVGLWEVQKKKSIDPVIRKYRQVTRTIPITLQSFMTRGKRGETGHGVWLGGTAYFPVNHSKSSYSWVSVQSGMQMRAVSAFLCVCYITLWFSSSKRRSWHSMKVLGIGYTRQPY